MQPINVEQMIRENLGHVTDGEIKLQNDVEENDVKRVVAILRHIGRRRENRLGYFAAYRKTVREKIWLPCVKQTGSCERRVLPDLCHSGQ